MSDMNSSPDNINLDYLVDIEDNSYIDYDRIRRLDEENKKKQNSRLNYYEIRVDELIADPTPLVKVKMSEPTRSQKNNIKKKGLELYILHAEITYRKLQLKHHKDWITYNTEEWNTRHESVREPFLLLAQFLLYVEEDISKL